MLHQRRLAIFSGALILSALPVPKPDVLPHGVPFFVSEAHAQQRLKTLIMRMLGKTMPENIVRTNGRLEATQIDVAAKTAGRLGEVKVNEGDDVTAGQLVGRIISPETEAQLRGAEAQVIRAKESLAEAIALIAQRKSGLDFAKVDYDRGTELVKKGYMTRRAYDERRNRFDSATAALLSANATRDQAQANIKTAEAEVQRLQAVLADMALLAPRSGRVQYLIARSGEVVSAGSRVMTILDLHDVYMTIFVPAETAGKLALGDEARIILDPVPNLVIPANISFVAAEAQFTPKTVETAEEREKLMFRVKLQVDPDVLAKYYRRVKTGVRGIGIVRTAADANWPPELLPKLPKLPQTPERASR
jgi:HlyD family secretion protein